MHKENHVRLCCQQCFLYSFALPTIKQSTRTCLKCLVSGHFCLNSIKFHYTQRKPCKIMLLTVLICLAGFVFILFLLFLVAIRRAHSLLKLCLDNICIFYKFDHARKCLVSIMFSMIAFKYHHWRIITYMDSYKVWFSAFAKLFYKEIVQLLSTKIIENLPF